MSERRLFVADLPDAGGVVTLSDASARHARVLRLEVGARVRLFDGRAREADAHVRAIERDAVRCEAEPPVEVEVPRPHAHVLLGTAKGAKLEDTVRTLTELGVFAIHPVVCARSVARPTAASFREGRQRRLERIALEACAQSGQTRAPDLYSPMALDEATALAPADAVRLVFWEDATTDLDAAFATQRAHASELWVVIGPEGGLAVEEIEALAARGYSAVGLGEARLRVETAAPVAVALALARVGRLRP